MGLTSSVAVVLVEGASDQAAVEALARRCERDLEREGVAVVPIGGAQAIGRFLSRYGETRLAGLYDIAQEREFVRGLERAGFGTGLTRTDLEHLGFFACVEDLEDELIRALGPAAVEAALEAHGDLGPFRTFQKQPEWREQAVDRQLHRFLASGARRKIRYARHLVDALDLDRVPRPLDSLLAHV
jgi:hypothetical protein